MNTILKSSLFRRFASVVATAIILPLIALAPAYIAHQLFDDALTTGIDVDATAASSQVESVKPVETVRVVDSSRDDEITGVLRVSDKFPTDDADIMKITIVDEPGSKTHVFNPTSDPDCIFTLRLEDSVTYTDETRSSGYIRLHGDFETEIDRFCSIYMIDPFVIDPDNLP